MKSNHPQAHEPGVFLIGSGGPRTAVYEPEVDWYACDEPERPHDRHTIFIHDCSKCLLLARAQLDGKLTPAHDPPLEPDEKIHMRLWLDQMEWELNGGIGLLR